MFQIFYVKINVFHLSVRLYTVLTFLLRLPLHAGSTDHDCNTYGMAESNSEGGGQNGGRQL